MKADKSGEKLELKTTSPSVSRTSAKGAIILIVDDNQELLKYLKVVMRNERWNVLTASSAKQAFEIVSSKYVDVALIDYMLPDLDGFALSKRIRETASHTKIILMTGGGEMSVSDESGLGPNVPVLQKTLSGGRRPQT